MFKKKKKYSISFSRFGLKINYFSMRKLLLLCQFGVFLMQKQLLIDTCYLLVLFKYCVLTDLTDSSVLVLPFVLCPRVLGDCPHASSFCKVLCSHIIFSKPYFEDFWNHVHGFWTGFSVSLDWQPCIDFTESLAIYTNCEFWSLFLLLFISEDRLVYFKTWLLMQNVWNSFFLLHKYF